MIGDQSRPQNVQLRAAENYIYSKSIVIGCGVYKDYDAAEIRDMP